ncbi:hypothetical protein FHX81_3409 [Saccharothrix saharensis]|uniref:Uncharacterized protein n=1 Tax=Saccharothrix saharensis TaxID=571190 RepID=A0A543JDW8_9PSEU|nr:hypothetical protein [Saccharothrix saharensis]TQM81048.1 hypothetical protein FHX81_3409 [Saccharothrix saharensis]
MSRPTREGPGGRAHLDSQNRARREGRPTGELIGGSAEQREKACRAFEQRLGGDGHRLPPTLAEVVSVVVEFPDTLVAEP